MISKENFNKFKIHSDFKKTVSEIKDCGIKIPQDPVPGSINFGDFQSEGGENLVTDFEDRNKYELDPSDGRKLAEKYDILGYDESVNKFTALEGEAYLTSHSIVFHGKDDYIPTTLVTLYFYTKSRRYIEETESIKYTEEPEKLSKKDSLQDRNEFIARNVPEDSIVFIDGPLIGKQATSYTLKLNQRLLENDVVPIFFVKNSTSDLVTNNLQEGSDYNSDLHWAYENLGKGERTSFFKYVDQHNRRNSKIFTYVKPFNVSPQRVEFHTTTWKKYNEILPDLMDLIYYLMLVQGDRKNPQIRSIAVAEKYAREALNVINLQKIIKKTGIMPTINQERFAW